MNTSENTSRPLGYWLTATDRLLSAEFARAFEAEGISRRDWRLLNVVDGTAPARRPLDEHTLGHLIELGWVAPAEAGWELTDEGRTAKARLGEIVNGIRSTVASAVSAEDYATTLAALEQIARALGWDENTPLPRKRHGRRGFDPRGHRHGGRGFHGRHGFGPHPDDDFGHHVDEGCRGHRDIDSERAGRHGEFGHGHSGRHGGFGPARHGRHGEFDHDRTGSHGEFGPMRFAHPGRGEFGPAHAGGGYRRAAHLAQHAYERGFDAGFERGNAAR